MKFVEYLKKEQPDNIYIYINNKIIDPRELTQQELREIAQLKVVKLYTIHDGTTHVYLEA